MNKKKLNETIEKIISKNKDNNIKTNLMKELLESLQKLENEIIFHKRTSSLDELVNVIENYKSKINEN